MIENRNDTGYCNANIKKSVEAIEQYFKSAEKIEIEMINAFCEKKLFGNFYKIFLNTAFLYFNEKSNLLLEKGFGNIIDQVYERIEKIPIRILIEDIHKQRNEQKLLGKNIYDEYQYYQTAILSSTVYATKIWATYPVMKALILHQIYQFIEYLCEIERAINRDKGVIVEKFCSNKVFNKVLDIKLNLSDPHRNGRTVAKVDLDNGYSIIYKPHNLKKEVLMNEIYQVFMENSTFQFRIFDVLDRQTYGWEEYIATKECSSEDEVVRYFERMGAILFICYLFGATDIHCENIIASGEFPVLIDLETIPGIILKENPRTAEEFVSKKISNSVIRTGILPTIVWGKNGEGVMVSALGKSKNMKSPFNLPYVKEAFSSAIHISYVKKDISVTGSLPIMQGNIVDATTYSTQICRGFEKAYRLYMNLQTQLSDMVRAVLEQKGRVIFRHTQQYSMYSNISFYPQFLRSWEEREKFFDTLNVHKKYAELYQYEKMTLNAMDIPVFEVDVKRGTTYDGDSREYRLQNFNIDDGYYKMKHFCESDLAYQEKCIKLSLDMLTDRRLPKLLNVNEPEGITAKEKIVANIADYICESAVIFEGNISWDNLTFYDNNTWRLVPIDLDLYDGIGGIAIFLASINMTYPSEKYKKILKLIQNKLFVYTDYNGHSMENPRTKDCGILKGEGSIVYTYLLLYKITGDKKFLDYAEKHYSQYEKIFLQCQNPDYLSGSAGAIIVLVKLYSETGNKKYLNVAEMLGEKIWKKAKKQKEGYGIVSENDKLPPLAGMAHGTSGYIIAYAYLYEQIRRPEYFDRIIELLKYEDSLFDSELRNWIDFRENGERRNTIAWCHGAPGIAVARLKLSNMEQFRYMKEIEKDIDKCRHAIEINKKNDSLCLCHGLSGNYWIKKNIYEIKSINNGQKIQEDLMKIVNRVEYILGILPRERYNVSLMTGITGIGLLLNDEVLCREIFL